MSVLKTTTSNSLAIGYGAAINDYATIIYGKNIRLRYGHDTSDGLFLNSSGNVTIGSSDLATTNYRLYVNGATKIYGNIEAFFFKTPTGYGLYQWNHYSVELKEKDIAISGNNIILNPTTYVGICTKTPAYPLDVNGDSNINGNLNVSKQIKSTVSTGTAPISVSSSTMCPKLNANYLGGYTIDDVINALQPKVLDFTSGTVVYSNDWIKPFNSYISYY